MSKFMYYIWDLFSIDNLDGKIVFITLYIGKYCMEIRSVLIQYFTFRQTLNIVSAYKINEKKNQLKPIININLQII